MNRHPIIAVTGRIPDDALAMLREVGGVRAWMSDEVIPVGQRDEWLAGADVAVTLLTDTVDGAFLDAGPNLKLVANVAVGYSNIDVAECAARGVHVSNTPGVLTDATADLAMALILMSTRRLGEGERLIRAETPWQWGMFMMLGTGLQDKTLGIVGMGGIGEALATRARAFGLNIVYHNRRAVDPSVEERLGTRLVGMDELLATSDIVSLNCPYTDATHHLIDSAALASMKPSAYLVNTARGPIVDEAALVDALTSGIIAGAALDVFENEPAVHPGLLACDNAVLIPHLGSATVETRTAMATTAAANVIEVLAGRAPLNAVHVPPNSARGRQASR